MPDLTFIELFLIILAVFFFVLAANQVQFSKKKWPAIFFILAFVLFVWGFITAVSKPNKAAQPPPSAQSEFSVTQDCSKPLPIAEVVELIETSKDMQLIDNSPEQVCYTVEFPDEHLSIAYLDRRYDAYLLSKSDELIYTWQDARGLPFFVFMWEDIATGELIHLHHTEENPEPGNMSYLPQELFRRWALRTLCEHAQ